MPGYIQRIFLKFQHPIPKNQENASFKVRSETIWGKGENLKRGGQNSGTFIKCNQTPEI